MPLVCCVSSGLAPEPMATITRSVSSTNSAPALGTGRRRPEASGSPSSISWQRTFDDHAPLVAEVLQRRAEQLEDDPFLLGVMDLFAAGGHLLARAAVEDVDVLGAQPPRGSGRVHGHVAAAHHADAASADDRRVVFGKGVGLHQVRRG